MPNQQTKQRNDTRKHQPKEYQHWGTNRHLTNRANNKNTTTSSNAATETPNQQAKQRNSTQKQAKTRNTNTDTAAMILPTDRTIKQQRRCSSRMKHNQQQAMKTLLQTPTPWVGRWMLTSCQPQCYLSTTPAQSSICFEWGDYWTYIKSEWAPLL